MHVHVHIHRKQQPQGLRIVKDNKLRGAYGESDFDKNLIRVNVKSHSQKEFKRINPLPDGNEDLASTVQHELLHFKHKDMKEQNVRKLEKKIVAKMGAGQKAKLRAKIQ